MYLKMNEIFSDLYSDGIFKALETNIDDLPWADDVDAVNIDTGLAGSLSYKYANPMMRHIHSTYKDSDGKISAVGMKYLAEVLWAMYGHSWTKLYATLSLEYAPIENYDRTEETHNIHLGKETDATTRSGSDTHKYEVAGFNSGTFENSSQDTETAGIGSTTVKSFPAESSVDKRDDKVSSHIHGNIGVTTSQQMLQSEIDLWQWHFFRTVYIDISNYLCLKIYGEE